MNKVVFPALLAATIMVAGAFAFMPVEQASTVHASGVLTSTAFATGAVDSAAIATDTIVAGDIATGAVGTLEILDATILGDDIAAGAVDTAEIQNDAVTTAEIAADTIVAADIATDAIGALELADNSVALANMLDSSVGTTEIVDDTITAADIATDAVGASELADNSVALANMLDSSVGTTEIVDDTIGPEDVTGSTSADALVRFLQNSGAQAAGAATDETLSIGAYDPPVTSIGLVSCTAEVVDGATAGGTLAPTLTLAKTAGTGGAIVGQAALTLQDIANLDTVVLQATWVVTGVDDSHNWSCTVGPASEFDDDDLVDIHMSVIYFPE